MLLFTFSFPYIHNVMFIVPFWHGFTMLTPDEYKWCVVYLYYVILKCLPLSSFCTCNYALIHRGRPYTTFIKLLFIQHIVFRYNFIFEYKLNTLQTTVIILVSVIYIYMNWVSTKLLHILRTISYAACVVSQHIRDYPRLMYFPPFNNELCFVLFGPSSCTKSTVPHVSMFSVPIDM